MAKDFDTARRERQQSITEDDRTFTLGGHRFVALREVHPSALVGYDSITTESSLEETLEIVDDTILNMIEDRDGSHGRYVEIRASRDDIITVEDLLEVVKWLMESQTGRPTGPPSVSEPTPPSTVTALTAVSS